jgi:Flp pilus assembly protein TadG
MTRRSLWLGEVSGAVAPTVALSLFALIGAGGIAFDYARLASMDTELQNAADQAALAAATQLDKGSDACARAGAAAENLLSNETFFANDGGGSAITVFARDTNGIAVPETACDQADNVRFWQDKAKTQPATSGAQARFVEVIVNGRVANYALTPVVAAFNSGTIAAAAMAGLGSAICKVPPLMICNPNPGTPFPVTPGVGVRVVAHQNGQSWSAGNFGFLNVGQSNNGAPDLLGAMAYQDASLTCQDVDTGDVDTGATVPALDAANTRFDIYNFGSGSGSTLGACYSGSCPAAANVTKDFIHPTTDFTSNNTCKIHNSGWRVVTGTGAFAPRPPQSGDTAMTQLDNGGGITAMGLPRDNKHYASHDSTLCGGARICDGAWARGDYFNKYHSGSIPTGAASWTRYQTYRWEIDNSNMPGANGTGVNGQYGAPKCSTGSLDPERDRRVFTVAIAENCSSLSGSSTPVTIGKWVDMFFVEPASNDRGNGSLNDEIYLEVIGEADTTGDGTNAQVIRRDVPYLVE